ncbi:hypothetical protein TNIN_477891 [Trichonephila inaurata madagascariensis]|uniref:Uncharacterized protein n=1 Tax=Trichonephila inaurata madagascariensis TaxID=2747483 RepID=A0A8X7C0Y4_9ARAC|nr:hypothetical protein TNIN_477891 [Trichonephila inaurata madagascariensis]
METITLYRASVDDRITVSLAFEEVSPSTPPRRKHQKKPAESLKQAKSPTTNKADDKCCFKKKLPSEDIRPTTSSLQQMGRKPRRGGDIPKICRRYPENVYLPFATAVENKTGK